MSGSSQRTVLWIGLGEVSTVGGMIFVGLVTTPVLAVSTEGRMIFAGLATGGLVARSGRKIGRGGGALSGLATAAPPLSAIANMAMWAILMLVLRAVGSPL